LSMKTRVANVVDEPKALAKMDLAVEDLFKT
jgi:hypothetical protein